MPRRSNCGHSFRLNWLFFNERHDFQFCAGAFEKQFFWEVVKRSRHFWHSRFPERHRVAALQTSAEPAAANEATHYCWPVIIRGGSTFEVCCLPELTAAEMVALISALVY